jgi:hypothetical protein
LPELEFKPPCARCLVAAGRLCRSCAETDRSILPQLAVNFGWLKLIGQVIVEQRKRQTQRASKPRVRPPSKARQRKAKKNQVRNAYARMQRSVQGEHLRNTKVA